MIGVDGDEAHHAVRVKRVRPGERIGLLDTQGTSALGTLVSVGGSRSKPLLSIELQQIEREEPIAPCVELYAALPKGDRLDRMIDQLTQLGVTRYRPLLCEHAQRKPETLRVDKLQRIVEEAMKQCRRAWRLEIGDPIPLGDAIADPDAFVADASGDVWVSARDSGARRVIMVGPEGGWSNTERDLFVDTGVRVRRFGMFVMRIEAAASAASAIAMGTSTR